jgi:hypothetical protein
MNMTCCRRLLKRWQLPTTDKVIAANKERTEKFIAAATDKVIAANEQLAEANSRNAKAEAVAGLLLLILTHQRGEKEEKGNAAEEQRMKRSVLLVEDDVLCFTYRCCSH